MTGIHAQALSTLPSAISGLVHRWVVIMPKHPPVLRVDFKGVFKDLVSLNILVPLFQGFTGVP